MMEGKIVHASPTKEFFVSMLVKDILLKQAIIELIDNSLDGARLKREDCNFDGLNIEVIYDEDHFEIRDNCGGIPLQVAADYAFRFGRPKGIETSKIESTGIFGIGMKRALFKMGEYIVIKSKTLDTEFQMTIDVNKWLESEKQEWDFEFDYYEENMKNKSEETGTKIVVTHLYREISGEFGDPEFQKELIDHIERRVGLDLANGIYIAVNQNVLASKNIKVISSEEMSPVKESYVDVSGVKVDIIAGVAPKESGKSLPEHAGWYIYCNGRLIVAADKTSLTTWKDMENKNSDVAFHNSYASFRGMVMFSSKKPEALPWNTTKTGIDATSLVYLRAKEKMLEIFKIVRSFYDETKAYNKENEDDAIDLSLSKMKSIEITKQSTQNQIALNRSMTIKTIKTDPNPNVTISYKKPKMEVIKLKTVLGVSSNKEVGEKTFEYYMDAEC